MDKTLITDQSALEDFCETLSRAPFITVDTEFLREKTYYPKLCLVQAGAPDGKAAAIDPLAPGLDMSPFYDLLFHPGILKVFHAARQDLEIFYKLCGRLPTPFFDTQIAAMVCGYGDSVGYENLVRNLTGQSLDKSVQFTDWSRRPLSQKQIDYALGDVIYLVDIYRKLSAELERRGRTSWVYEEEGILAHPDTYDMPPERAWERIKLRSPKPKTLAVLQALAAWRERRAREKNLPRSWIIKDETLADMAAQAPETADQMARIRGISQELAQGRTGAIVLGLIKNALESPPSAWPQPERKKDVPPQAHAIIDLLKMLLKIQCAEHEVAMKLVASQEDLEDLATHDNADLPLLHGWRYEVFGQFAVQMKNGELAIGLKNNKILKLKME